MQQFFSMLFDLSFKKFVTPKLVSYIYLIAVAYAAITSLLLLKAPFGFVVAPLTFVTSLIVIRVGLELVLAVFQIARYSAEIARRGRPNTEHAVPEFNDDAEQPSEAPQES